MMRRIVLVSGAPGSGKSTLAAPLARELGYPLISKDKIKETLWDVLAGAPGEAAQSRQLGAAAMEIMWALAASCPAAILEAPFRTESSIERAHLDRLDARYVEVRCCCPPEVAIARYNARAPARHGAHVLQTLTPEHWAEYAGDLHVGPVINVDTTIPVDVQGLADHVRGLLR